MKQLTPVILRAATYKVYALKIIAHYLFSVLIYVENSKNLLKKPLKPRTEFIQVVGIKVNTENLNHIYQQQLLKLKIFCAGGIKYKNFRMNLIKCVQGLYSENLQESVAKE